MKYKHSAAKNWYLRIDDTGNKFEFSKRNKPGFYAEMQKWVNAGNEIEPQYTADELAQKEADELAAALEAQKSECLRLLSETDHKVLPDAEYPGDIDIWKKIRVEWRLILKSDKILKIPPKPW